VIEQEKSSSPITGERMDYESYNSQALTFNTHFKLIKSFPVVRSMITELKLDDENRNHDLEISALSQLVRRFKANVKLLFNLDEGRIQLPHEKEQALIATVNAKITIEQVRDTRLLKVAVKDKDPEAAASIANTLAKKYIEFNLANRVQASQETLEWMNNELYALKKRLEDDEKKFFDFKKDAMVFSIQGKQKVVEQKIGEFNNRYLETRNKRLALDAKIAELERNLVSAQGIANVRSLINNPVIDTIYNKILDLEIELSRMSKVYKAKHPKVLQAQSELAKSRKRLEDELHKEMENLKSERKVLFANEKVLENTIAEFEKDALDTSGKELQYTILQRNVNTSQNLYDALVARVKESDILKSADTSNIRLVESAVVPADPVSPDKKKNLLIGMALGLFLGVALAFFLEYMDQTIRTEEDVQKFLNLPVLSVVPEADKRESSYGGKA
jgi:uncharacterized protein involved in exopolysaccharide biosynthesis